MKIRDLENALKYRRIPYPKRSVELIALIAISSTFFLFMHTKSLNTRLREMEVKLQPSEFSALGLSGENHVSGGIAKHPENMNSLHGTYQYLKSTGQIFDLNTIKLNNTKYAERDLLFFNRIPKTGSGQLIRLINDLGKIHHYNVHVDPQIEGVRVILDEKNEKEMVEKISNMKVFSTFVSHVNFLNFSRYDQLRPIYVNMVRDPVERVISWYYYIRAPWIFVPQRRRGNRPMPSVEWVNQDFDECVHLREKVCTYIEGSPLEGVGDHRRQTLFFCGHNSEECAPFNSEVSLQAAKRRVESEYAVVGTWEDPNVTLTVLENYIPRYFKGASKLYYLGLNKEITNNNPMKPKISEKLKDIVRKNFTREIEFYQFCRQRIHKQYIAVLKTFHSKNIFKNV